VSGITCVLSHGVLIPCFSDRNGVARAENSTALRANAELVPLWSVLSGNPIDRCPETLRDLEGMSGKLFVVVPLSICANVFFRAV
jgi:hypothetical protein